MFVSANSNSEQEDLAALLVIHLLEEPGAFRNPDSLQPPLSFMPLLVVKISLRLRHLFYSSGLFRAIPSNMVDESFSLPYPVILWVCSWFDEDPERSAQFHSLDITRNCFDRCRSSGTAISMAHLAVLSDCKPAFEWTRILVECGDDLNHPLQLAVADKIQNILLVLNQSYSRLEGFDVIPDLLLRRLSSITPFGLAALLGQYGTLESFISLGIFRVCFQLLIFRLCTICLTKCLPAFLGLIY